MKLVVDSSTLISLSESCLFKIVQHFNQDSRMQFFIPESVLQESIARPLGIKKYELSAVRINQGVLAHWMKVWKNRGELDAATHEIEMLSNELFTLKGHKLTIIHRGEAEALALAKHLGAELVAIDERTARLIMEDPKALQEHIEFKYHDRVEMNQAALRRLQAIFPQTKVIRSIELVALAFERGYFEGELAQEKQSLEAALYALKNAGCAISGNEIDAFLKGVKA